MTATRTTTTRTRRKIQIGRTCAQDGCETVLSRYNATRWCALHHHMPARTPYVKRA